ncbi:hypothetical protein VBM87_01695 [Mycoplasma sp. 744]|uniref:MAG3720 family protein n=1 Tax=Mycoplasma sp. 744 TaxID=3108531 RepID=UPI002B1DC950|nr:hypothetical protein [Mycoplasma sp. 744]MEA4115493.1 hypothetical protein [Mycoplasma sp. 744]
MRNVYFNYLISKNKVTLNVIEVKDQKNVLLYEKNISLTSDLKALDLLMIKHKELEKQLLTNKKKLIIKSNLILDESLHNYYELESYQAEILVKSNLITKEINNELEKQMKTKLNTEKIILNQTVSCYKTIDLVDQLKIYRNLPLNKIAKSITLIKNYLLITKNNILDKIIKKFNQTKIFFNNICTKMFAQAQVDNNSYLNKIYLELNNYSWTLAKEFNKNIICNSYKEINYSAIFNEIFSRMNLSTKQFKLLVNSFFQNDQNLIIKNLNLSLQQKLFYQLFINKIEKYFQELLQELYSYIKDGYKIVFLENSACTFSTLFKNSKFPFEQFKNTTNISNLSTCMQGIIKYSDSIINYSPQEKTISNISLNFKSNFFNKLFFKFIYLNKG